MLRAARCNYFSGWFSFPVLVLVTLVSIVSVVVVVVVVVVGSLLLSLVRCCCFLSSSLLSIFFVFLLYESSGKIAQPGFQGMTREMERARTGLSTKPAFIIKKEPRSWMKNNNNNNND